MPMRILLTGARGQLGTQLQRALAGHDIIPAARPDFDLESYRSVRATVESSRADIVIHSAAMTDVDGCERDPDQAYRTNTLGTHYVALASQAIGATLVAVGTDYIFDGGKGSPYLEYDDAKPLSVYGQTKLAGERAALMVHDRCYVVRTSWVYSPTGRNFVKTVLRLSAERPTLTYVDDERGSPTYAGDLAEAIASLVTIPAYGIYHFSNEGSCSRFDFAQRIAALAGRTAEVRPISAAEFQRIHPLPARRPADSSLRNVAGAALGIRLRGWDAALADVIGTVAESHP